MYDVDKELRDDSTCRNTECTILAGPSNVAIGYFKNVQFAIVTS